MHCDMKMIEILDHATCIPVLAFSSFSETEKERRIFSTCGYGKDPLDHQKYIFVIPIQTLRGVQFDPFVWGGRTMPAAHQYIIDHFDELASGDIVDVRVVLGEAETPGPSNYSTCPITLW